MEKDRKDTRGPKHVMSVMSAVSSTVVKGGARTEQEQSKDSGNRNRNRNGKRERERKRETYGAARRS